MDVCETERMPEHIPRYMDRTSYNNITLINNSSCHFAIRVVYTKITVT